MISANPVPQVILEQKPNCLICLEDLEDANKKILALKCAHVFHNECINEWVQQKPTCPACRADIKYIGNGKIAEANFENEMSMNMTRDEVLAIADTHFQNYDERVSLIQARVPNYGGQNAIVHDDQSSQLYRRRVCDCSSGCDAKDALFKTSCCFLASGVSCWGTGAGLMVNAGTNSAMLIAGKVLVGVGAAIPTTLTVGFCGGAAIITYIFTHMYDED